MKRAICMLLMVLLVLGTLSACTKQEKTESEASQESSQTVFSKEDSSEEESSAEESSVTEEPDQPAETTGQPAEDELVMSVSKSEFAASYEDLYQRLSDMYSNYGWYEDEGVWVDEDAEEGDFEADLGEAEAPAASENEAKGDDYSHTNTQEEGVDEGDLVKTDGQYIYTIRYGNKLNILKAEKGNVKPVSETTIGGQGLSENFDWSYLYDLYISGDRLVVLAASFGGGDSGNGSYYFNQERTVAFVYDISDRSAPRFIRSIRQDGYYETSRLIENRLYLISNYSLYDIGERAYPEHYVPRYYIDGESNLLQPGEILCPEGATSRQYTVLGVIDITDASLLQTQAVLGGTQYVYMNTGGLYLTSTQYEDIVTASWEESVYQVEKHVSGDVTTICHYALDESGKLSYTADGKVSGLIYGQFALNEANGYLRVVTTGYSYTYTQYHDEKYGFTNTKENEDENAYRQKNNLFILDQNMEVVGSLTGLAPDEQVYSVRYDGDYAYFCTFRQIDPLFCVDVSDPAAPKELGALKIPGFSDYLHIYGEGRLFGLGRDADPRTGAVNGMKLTMFDTTDPTDLKVLFDIFPNAYYSEANYNHKAVLVDPAKDLIGFPTDNGYMIYGYNDQEGFHLKKTIYLSGYSWNSRGLYIGDYFYIVDETRVVVIDLNTLEQTAEIVY